MKSVSLSDLNVTIWILTITILIFNVNYSISAFNVLAAATLFYHFKPFHEFTFVATHVAKNPLLKFGKVFVNFSSHVSHSK